MSECPNQIHITGIPGLKKCSITVLVEETNLKIRRWNKVVESIPFADIKSVEVRKESDFIQGKEKDRSVIGRALVGGVLLGPVGGVVGGLSGVPKKTIRD